MELPYFSNIDVFTKLILKVLFSWVLIWINIIIYIENDISGFFLYLILILLGVLIKTFIFNFYKMIKMIRDE